MLSVLVLHSLDRKLFIFQLRKKYSRWLKLDWFPVSPMYWQEVNTDMANSLVHICMIDLFSCLNLFLQTRTIALGFVSLWTVKKTALHVLAQKQFDC